MTRTRRIISLLLAAVMLVLCALPLASCGSDDDTPCTSHVDANGDGVCDKEGCGASMGTGTCQNHVDLNGDGVCDREGCNEPVAPAPAGKTKYTVQLKSVGGYKLSGVYLDLYDSETGALVTYEKTDKDGFATFEVATKETYYVSFGDGAAPAGYIGQQSYPLQATGTVITLATQLQPEGHAGVTYALGDIMHDFTVTTSDGTVIKLSELLKTKKAVVLNFWYTDCSWCIEEFPDIQTAYDTVIDEETGLKYSDLVEVVALDPPAANGDTMTSIRGFKADMDLTFPMGLDNDGIYASFGVGSFPTTVIVDRYGMVTVKHAGALLGASYWRKLFSYFTSDSYEQKTAATFEELMPKDKPNVQMPSSDKIAEYFDGQSNMGITYSPETKPGDAEFSWPFTTKTLDDGTKCIVPTNTGYDNSYATLYATVTLEAGEALMFDYHSSTELTDTNADVLYVIVDGKDMYSIAGLHDNKDSFWDKCCAFVAEEAGTYEVAFVYIKDTADDDLAGVEDTIYLSNLQRLDKSEVDVPTYIFRYADGLTSGQLYLSDVDGYYHVGSADGPILLANLIGYTPFESKLETTNARKTVSERLTEAGTFLVGGTDRYNDFIKHANYSVNSRSSGYTSVTEELYTLLDAYVRKYAATAGVTYTANTWLTLCAYYNAYGTGGEEMADPIKGLTSFSAFETLETTDPNNKQYNTVTFETVVMPRGYLYKFVPTKSGAYRITTQSDGVTMNDRIDAWIFVGDHYTWPSVQERVLYDDSGRGERYNLDLLVEGENGFERDYINASMITYLEAGKTYYLAFGYDDIYKFDTFTFTVTYEAEAFNAFFEASPGTFTFEEGLGGAVGDTIAGGIDVMISPEDGIYRHLISTETDKQTGLALTDADRLRGEGSFVEKSWENDGIFTYVTEVSTTVARNRYGVLNKSVLTTTYKLGGKVYADLIWPTNIFTTRTMQQLINADSFDFTKTSVDLEALAIYTAYAEDGIKRSVIMTPWLTERFEEHWVADGTEAALGAAGKSPSEIAAVKAERLAAYISAMNETSLVIAPLFEEWWVAEDMEAELKKDGKTNAEIVEIKIEEFYNYCSTEFTGYDGYEIIFEGIWLTSGREDALRAEGMGLADIRNLKKAERIKYVADREAWDEYYTEMSATDEALTKLFNIEWAENDSEGDKAAALAAYLEEVHERQAAWASEFESVWEEGGYQAISDGLYDKNYFEGEYNDNFHEHARRGFYEYHGYEGFYYWSDIYDMDNLLIGVFHGSIHSSLDKEALDLFEKGAARMLRAEWGSEYTARWNEMRMGEVVSAFRLGTLSVADIPEASVSTFLAAGRAGVVEIWLDEMYESFGINDIIGGTFHGSVYSEDDLYIMNLALEAAYKLLASEWGEDFDRNWDLYGMDEMVVAFMNGTVRADELLNPDTVTLFVDALARGLATELGQTEADAAWSSYAMEQILDGTFHGSIKSAQDAESIEQYLELAREGLAELWGDEYEANLAAHRMADVFAAFEAGTLSELGEEYDGAVALFHSTVREKIKQMQGEMFDEKWASYQLDDVLAGIFHNDLTARMQAVLDANLVFDGEGNLEYEKANPERQGCVEVDAALAEMLQALMDKYTFAGVDHSWTKLCYYYLYLGPEA
ncbi:MAG: TlpA family protein disulfide reductase [Clostridia bacterium]|nr:TlpA family protein disulfide reductase [Clostridia bacterium]